MNANITEIIVDNDHWNTFNEFEPHISIRIVDTLIINSLDNLVYITRNTNILLNQFFDICDYLLALLGLGVVEWAHAQALWLYIGVEGEQLEEDLLEMDVN